MALTYILVYHKGLSVHSAVHFNHISKTIEVIIKLHLLKWVKKHPFFASAFNINLTIIHVYLIAIKCQKTLLQFALK